ncbi:MAG TPA: metal-dependent hydrolase [Candidatus Acidoferrales bacterium]|nr:metal-dependent hydrolase [Candidatus Acidoferrales bacterium]
MDPVTHALASLTLGKAGLARATRLAMPMLVVAGVAGDADWLSVYSGPAAFLRWHRTATDSLVGAAAIAIIVAGIFTLFARGRPDPPVSFPRALLVSGIAAYVHVLLDWTNSYGVYLLWPFRQTWYAGDLLPPVDIWLLGVLVIGLAVPWVFRLATEEIGARAKRPGFSYAATPVLIIAVLYAGWRWEQHRRALTLLRTPLFHGEVVLGAGAFPGATSLFTWSGVVDTQNTLDTVQVGLLFQNEFDPLNARVLYKPEPSPELAAARATQTAATFLSFARFPWAEVEKSSTGSRVVITDLRFDQAAPSSHQVSAVIELNAQGQVVAQGLHFGPVASALDE